MKYCKDIEILYEKIYIISKYCPILNSNANTVITNMNNIESSTDSDSSNKLYNINNNNNKNNIVNNNRISDSKNINIIDCENNSVIISNVVNSSIGEYRVNLSNFLNNECVNICDMVWIYITSFLVEEIQTLLI